MFVVLTVLVLVFLLGLPAQAGPGGGDDLDPCHPPHTGLILC
jgi:hypothetical protein